MVLVQLLLMVYVGRKNKEKVKKKNGYYVWFVTEVFKD